MIADTKAERGTQSIIDPRCNRRIKDYSPFVEKSRNSNRPDSRHRGCFGMTRPHEGDPMPVQERVAPEISMQDTRDRDASRRDATLTLQSLLGLFFFSFLTFPIR